MKNEESTDHIVPGKHGITSLPLMYKTFNIILIRLKFYF